VFCPVSRCALPEDILQIDSRTAFNEKPNEFVMAGQRSLMNWCRMGMEPNWVVPVWIFARIKQRSNDLNLAKL
jgi:hypothetical protein